MGHTTQTVDPEAHPPLPVFADWLRDTDDHADHHLALICRVECCLSEFNLATDKSRELAEKLERWRYQHLNERDCQLSAVDEKFIDALDLTANRLAGRTARLPRRTHHALHDSSLETQSLSEATETLDPRFPLEALIDRAGRITAEHFGPLVGGQTTISSRRQMLLYAPLYVSSHCVNHCTYCGFSYSLDIQRRHLTLDEVAEQIAVLQNQGFGHLLIVGGDFPRLTTTGYYCDVAQAMRSRGIIPAIEIAPQATSSYEALVAAGVHGLTLYQETYDERLYAEYHQRGPKANYHWRLESHDRAAEAGMPRLGLGVLLGLADPRQDVLAMMRHGAYLLNRFPDRTLAFSLPRIHEGPDGFSVKHPVSDEQLIRLYCALRVAFPTAPLVLSTRESIELRTRLAEICITQMSAGSSTTPGGYGNDEPTDGEQFAITDERSPAEVAERLEQAGFRVAWSLEH